MKKTQIFIDIAVGLIIMILISYFMYMLGGYLVKFDIFPSDLPKTTLIIVTLCYCILWIGGIAIILLLAFVLGGSTIDLIYKNIKNKKLNTHEKN